MGQWNLDKSIPDNWSISSKKGLQYEGYEEGIAQLFGDEASFHLEIYTATDDASPYGYFVCADDVLSHSTVLVTDYPSLLMLIKEMLPLIEDARAQELYEMQQEEHLARIKQFSVEHDIQVSCTHH